MLIQKRRSPGFLINVMVINTNGNTQLPGKPGCILSRMVRQVVLDDPGDQGVLPRRVELDDARHIGVDDLIHGLSRNLHSFCNAEVFGVWQPSRWLLS